MADKTENQIVAERLVELGKRVEEYEIADGIAIYRGAPVDYKKIKKLFYIRVSETIFEGKTAATTTTTLLKELGEVEKKEKTKPEGMTEVSTEVEVVKSATKIEKKDEDEEKDVLEIYDKLDSIKLADGTEETAEKIANFFNVNGVSKTRTNLLYINKKTYTMNELAATLQIQNKADREKEKTDRSEITVERIASAFAEETARFLKKNKKLIKIKELGYLGFTKSFFCKEVKKDPELAAKVYKAYIYYAKSWKSGNPKRFSEKMRVFYSTYLNFAPSFFEEIEEEIAKEEELRARRKNIV